MAADGSAPTSWRAANLGLLALAVVLLVTSVLLLTRGATAAPGNAEARRLAARYAGVTRAARAETQAFLGVDYRDPDPQVERVLAGATGAFASGASAAVPAWWPRPAVRMPSPPVAWSRSGCGACRPTGRRCCSPRARG